MEVIRFLLYLSQKFVGIYYLARSIARKYWLYSIRFQQNNFSAWTD